MRGRTKREIHRQRGEGREGEHTGRSQREHQPQRAVPHRLRHSVSLTLSARTDPGRNDWVTAGARRAFQKGPANGACRPTVFVAPRSTVKIAGSHSQSLTLAFVARKKASRRDHRICNLRPCDGRSGRRRGDALSPNSVPPSPPLSCGRAVRFLPLSRERGRERERWCSGPWPSYA